MPKVNQSEPTLQQVTLFALAFAIAMLILFLSIWATTTKPIRSRILGNTCPEYLPVPTGCKSGITTGTNQNGCLTITCYRPKPELKPTL